MRIIVALLVILVGSAPARADRATTIAQDLQLSTDVGARVVSTLATYDTDLYKLQRERAEIRRQLMTEHTDSISQKLLDDMIGNAQALVQLDQNLLGSLRAQLAPDQVLRVFMLLNASEPEAPRMLPPQHPGPINKPSCNPVAQPHRCA